MAYPYSQAEQGQFQPPYPPAGQFPGGQSVQYPPQYPPAGPYQPQPGYPSNPQYPPGPGQYPGFPPQYPDQQYQQQPPPNPEFQNQSGGGDQADGYDAFSDKAVRNAFIQKVYAILAAQFLLTFVICIWFMSSEQTKKYFRGNKLPLYLSMGVYLVTAIALSCCQSVQRKVPINYILLALLTGSMSVMLGVVCAFSNQEAVLIAAGITFATTLAVSIFSCSTKFDFTKFLHIAAVLGLVLLLVGLVAMFWKVKAVQLVYACFGTLVTVLYLAIDTQMIMGGKRFEISAEDYVFAALNLYLDIVQMFLFILKIVTAMKNDN